MVIAPAANPSRKFSGSRIAMDMKSFIKRYSGWDRKSPQYKTDIHHKISVARFKTNYAVAAIFSFMPVSIGKLFTFFGSDKQQKGGHDYGATYAEVLRRFRYRPITFLEIGIGGFDGDIGGNSLLAWRGFFPFGKIVACDIVPKHELATGRLRICQMDQSSAGDLARLTTEHGPFDVVVDDGSHLNAHQIFTFERLFDAVTESGLYIIEDVQTSYWTGKVDGKVPDIDWDGYNIAAPEFSQTCVGYFLELAKYINYQEFVDLHNIDMKRVHFAKNIKRISFEHNLILIEKGRNESPSNWLAGRETAAYPLAERSGNAAPGSQ